MHSLFIKDCSYLTQNVHINLILFKQLVISNGFITTDFHQGCSEISCHLPPIVFHLGGAETLMYTNFKRYEPRGPSLYKIYCLIEVCMQHPQNAISTSSKDYSQQQQLAFHYLKPQLAIKCLILTIRWLNYDGKKINF